MKFRFLLFTFIMTFFPIVCFAQYSGYIGDRIALDAPPTDNRSYPDFYDATWKVTSGSKCVTLSPATGQHITAVVSSKGSATITCSARYYNRSNLGAYYRYVNKSYTITCMEKDNGGGGNNGGGNTGGGTGSGTTDGDDSDHFYHIVYNEDGVPIKYSTITNAFYGGVCAQIEGWDDMSCIPTSTSGLVKIPSEADGHVVFQIGTYAFHSLPYVTDIVFPSSIGVYSDYSVHFSSSLRSITVLSTRLPYYITDNAFSVLVYEYVTLYVPKGCKEMYSKAVGFRSFKNIEEIVSDYTITTSSDGYATFYDSKHDFFVPEGLVAQTVVGISNGKLSYNNIADGSSAGIIPKGTAVILSSNEKSSKSYTLVASDTNEKYDGINYLYGSDTTTTTNTSGNNYYYKLTYGQGANQDVFGWYWGTSNGEAFSIEGHKAWLTVPQSMSRSVSFSVEDEVTDVNNVIDAYTSHHEAYNLQGRRVKHNSNGVYIVNGKKQLVR